MYIYLYIYTIYTQKHILSLFLGIYSQKNKKTRKKTIKKNYKKKTRYQSVYINTCMNYKNGFPYPRL